MNISKVIAQLRAQRDQVDIAIQALERFSAIGQPGRRPKSVALTWAVNAAEKEAPMITKKMAAKSKLQAI